MEVIVKNPVKTNSTTISRCYIEGVQQCFILEDKDRGLTQTMPLWRIKLIKIFGKTAIPAGRYQVIVNYSQRFKKDMPLLVNVPGYEGVRIHPGNSEFQTEGCLLPGTSTSTDWINESVKAFEPLFKKIKDAIASGQKVFITLER